MTVEDFLADQALGFGGDVDLHKRHLVVWGSDSFTIAPGLVLVKTSSGPFTATAAASLPNCSDSRGSAAPRCRSSTPRCNLRGCAPATPGSGWYSPSPNDGRARIAADPGAVPSAPPWPGTDAPWSRHAGTHTRPRLRSSRSHRHPET